MRYVEVGLSVVFWLLFGVWCINAIYIGMLWPSGWSLEFWSGVFLHVCALCLIAIYIYRRRWGLVLFVAIAILGAKLLWKYVIHGPYIDFEKQLAVAFMGWLPLLAVFGFGLLFFLVRTEFVSRTTDLQ